MIAFVKAHACGNDFLIVEESTAQGGFTLEQRSDLARRLCARSTGIGADGVEFVAFEKGAVIAQLRNADGSYAEISGNGTRCVAAWLAWTKGWESGEIVTGAGPRKSRVLSASGSHFEIQSDMGFPRHAPLKIQLEGADEVDGIQVSMGNPHMVLCADAIPEDWILLGKRIAEHPKFPQGTNVEFVRKLSSRKIEIRIYERGVGPTASSGTGSSAAAVATIGHADMEETVEVVSPGGVQVVHWDRKGPVLLSGPAEVIARGEAF